MADGKTLWLYDADLNQVTQRAQAQALGSTPAAFLTSAHRPQGLEGRVRAGRPSLTPMAWSGCWPAPRQEGGQLKSVRVGFTPKGDWLHWSIEDSFGQRSLMQFKGLQTQASLPCLDFPLHCSPGSRCARASQSSRHASSKKACRIFLQAFLGWNRGSEPL